VLDLRPPPSDSETVGLPVLWIEGVVRDPEIVAKSVRGVDAELHPANLLDWGTHPAKEV
jgi:hypothetical protein